MIGRLSVSIALLLTLTLPCIRGSAPLRAGQEPDTLRLRETVTRLASPDFQGRRCGTKEGVHARRYLRDCLRQLGLQPVMPSGSFELPFGVEGEELASSQAQLTSPEGQNFDLWLSVRSPIHRETGNSLLFWDSSGPAPPCAEGEMLLCYGPSGQGQPFTPTGLQAKARDAGASALILVPHPEDGNDVYRRYLSRVKQRDRRLYRLPGDPDERILAYAEPAEAESLLAGALSPTQGWRLDPPPAHKLRMPGVDLVARLPGSAQDSSRILLLVAHYDHLGPAEEGYYPGANDNASGVAVLLELARLLDDVSLSFELRFLFSDGEELGLLGAESYLRHFGPPWRVLNLDTVGRAGVDNYRKLRDPGAASDSLLILWQSDPDDDIAAALEVAARGVGFLAQAGRGPMFALGGDHHVFARAGVPSHFIFGGFYLDYNTVNDSAERILPTRLALLCEALRGWLLTLAEQG